VCGETQKEKNMIIIEVFCLVLLIANIAIETYLDRQYQQYIKSIEDKINLLDAKYDNTISFLKNEIKDVSMKLLLIKEATVDDKSRIKDYSNALDKATEKLKPTIPSKKFK
jgi:hypothetical protein